MRNLSPAELATLAPTGESIHPPLGNAEAAAALCSMLERGDVIAAFADETRAAAVRAILAALTPDATVLFCPGTDALPGDSAPPSPVNVGQRVSALRTVRQALAAKARSRIAIVTTGEALAQHFPAPEAFDAQPPSVETGAACDPQRLYAALLELGYVEDERVDEPGEVALRAQVLDVFPADATHPLRIEFSEGRIESLRFFDPIDQRSIRTIERQELGRVSEPPLVDPVSLIDHLPGATVVVTTDADERRRRSLLLTADAVRRGRPRAKLGIVDEESWLACLNGRESHTIEAGDDAPPRFVEARSPFAAFANFAREAIAKGGRIALMGAERDLRFLTRRIEKRLDAEALRVSSWAEIRAAAAGSFCMLAAPIERGFCRDGVLVVAAADLIGSRAERSNDSGVTVDAALCPEIEFRIGDTVIHEDHGIGRIVGVEAVPEGAGLEGDAIKLAYADGATRFVSVSEADLLWRYGSDADAVSLDTLDGKSWQKRRAGIDAAIAETARGLLALAAKRSTRTTAVLDPPVAAYERFAAGFPFSETPDQLTAIEAVRSDMASGRPMDRLVIGDVGFGKTEVALRAAAVAALSGKQVAVAAPTTVLARQHLESFADRFEGTGIVVAGLSRLSSAAEKRRVKAGLADGTIHIVIGTGAVAAKGVVYADLALVIVDEEQRFGTADKNRLQALGSGHLLTMSATPIPRTLQSALVGLRQMSMIATPPARRQPIRTTVSAFDGERLRAALLRERTRGGQSFVVVPRIDDMAPLAKQLGVLVPELDLLQAHGRMAPAEIDDAMVRFGKGEGDILLATNIIEAGLDVPRANTMAIVRADRFGLAQLHQLRGRVGRGNRRGQVMLFTAEQNEIAPQTLKRLKTLQAHDRLGAGFALSARDLDLRGAGDLLGETQAGHMKLIGVELYQQLLGDALQSASGKRIERWTPELNVGIGGCLPNVWIGDDDVRLSLYARFSRLGSDAELTGFDAELEDRFGDLPVEAERLLTIARIRERARALGIARIDAGPAAIALTLRKDADERALPKGLVERNGRHLFEETFEDPSARLSALIELLS